MYEQTLGVSVHDGFPNPATDDSMPALDLNKLLIKHSVGTYFMRLNGNNWEQHGIFDGDLVIIDRTLNTRRTDRVVAWHNNEFIITVASRLPKQAIHWGVVTYIIHPTRSEQSS